MGFESILNAVWLVLGAIALVSMLGRAVKNRCRTLCCIVVGLVVTTLFPVISASDDVVRIQHLERSHGTEQSRETNKQKQNSDTLIRLYEAMDTPLAATLIGIAFTLMFAFVIVSLTDTYVWQRTIARSGRSPPFALV